MTGFTFNKKSSTKIEGDYDNAKFYYTRNTYKIKFINKSKEDKSVEKKYEQSISSENYTPVRPGSLPDYYTFDGWYDNELCEGEAFDFNGKKMPAQNVTLYAKWTAKKINLTYNLNNPEGDVVKGIKKVEAGTIANTVLPSATTTSDYSFAGWYYADGNGNITSDAYNTNEAITKDTSVIGKWLYNGELKVVYDPGTEGTNAKVPTDSNIYAGGAKVTVAKNATTTSKKKFLGWKLKGNLYHPGDAFEVNKDLANNDNIITLKAIWGNEESSTTMSYDPGSGRGSVQTVPVKNNESVILKSEKDLGYQAPKTEGKEYYFAGWATSMDDAINGKATYAAGQSVHVDVDGENVLYATWIEKTVITLVANSNTVTYNGQSQEVNGFQSLTIDGYIVSGLNAHAQGTDVGTYPTEITGTAHVEKDNEDVTNKVVIKTTPGQLTITKKSIVPDDSNGIVVKDPKGSKYDGEKHENEPVVTDTKTGKTLVKGTDYTLTYSEDVINVGTVTVTITGTGNYEGTVDTSYEITKRNVTLTSANDSKPYDKTPLTNSNVTIGGDGFVKEEGATYNVTGSQTEKGTSNNTFTYELKSNTKASNYIITKEFGKLTVTAEDGEVVVIITGRKDTFEYTGTEKSVKGYDVSITEGSTYTESDFTFSGNDEVKGTEAGTYDMGLKPEDFTNNNGNYNKVKFVVTDGSLTITPKSINPEDEKSGITATDPADSIYNGEAHVNPLTVRDTKTGKDLVENKDYTLTYVGDVVNVGTVKIEVKGIGNYTGEFTKKYQITPREYTVTTDNAEKPYDGTALTAGGRVNGLVEGETVNFKTTGSQTNAGTSDNTYELKFKGTAVETNYKHGKDSIGQLKVTKKSIIPDDSNGIVVDGPKGSKYDGEKHENEPVVTDTKTGKTLAKGTDYTLTYSEDVINVGTVTVTITGIGNYEGTVDTSYEITKRNVTLTSASDSKVYDKTPLTNHNVTVGGDGFVKEEGATYNVTGSQTEKGTSKNTFTYGLKSNTKASNYTIEVVYGDLTVTAEDGEVVVVITGRKDTFEYDGTEKSVKGYDVSITEGSTYTESDFTFNGNDEVKGTEANTYPMGLKVSDFTNNNDNYNKVKFVVTDGQLTITPKSINPEDEKSGITATDPADSIYNGEAHVNPLKVTDTKTGKDLVENKDYTLTYVGDVVNVGTVKIEVKGIGNYTGKFTKRYKITPREYTVTTDSAEKTYDGTALTADGKIEGIVDGEVVVVHTTGSQTDVGSTLNTYELEWKKASSKNYKLKEEVIGTLTVTEQTIDPGEDPEKPNPNYLGIEISNPSDEVYDGKEHKWSPTVVDKEGNALVEGTDYTVKYATSDFTNVGTIDVTITGIGNYTGTVTRAYKITPKAYTVTTESATKVYDGTALTAGGKVNGIISGETVEFTTTGSRIDEGTSKNTYSLKWNGSAIETNYKLEKASIGDLTVKAKSIIPDEPDTPEEKKTGITVNEPSDSMYDGQEHKEVLIVKDAKTGKELVSGTEYAVAYTGDLVNAGTVTITVTGKGNYTGTFTKTYKITKRSVTLTSATESKTYDGNPLTNTSITVSGDGFAKGEGATYEVTGSQTEVGDSANAFEYKLNENTLASNYDITKVVGTLTVTAAPAPVTPATPSTPSTPSSTTSTTPRTLSAPQVTTPVETVEKETTPKTEPKKEEKVEEEYTPKASPQYYWALINLICAILTVLFGLLLLISKRHKDEDDEEEDDETKQQTTTNEDEEQEQEKKRGLFTRVLAVLIAIVSVVFFLVTEDMSLAWTWTDQWTIWMVVIGLVQIVVFFVGRKWKNVDDDDEDEQAQQA